MGHVFLKCTSLGLQHFFSSSTNLAISILSVLGRMYKIRVFEGKFYPLVAVVMVTVVMITEISIAAIAMDINSFNTFMQLINPKSPWKNGVKQIKNNQKKLSHSDIFYPSAKGGNAAKITFCNFTNTCHTTEWI